MRYGSLLSLLQQTATQYQGDQRDDEDPKIWRQEPHHAPRIFQGKPAGATTNYRSENVAFQPFHREEKREKRREEKRREEKRREEKRREEKRREEKWNIKK